MACIPVCTTPRVAVSTHLRAEIAARFQAVLKQNQPFVSIRTAQSLPVNMSTETKTMHGGFFLAHAQAH